MKKVLSMFLVLTIMLTVVGTMGTVMVSAAVTSTTTTYSEAFPALSTKDIKAGTYTPANDGDSAFSKIILADKGVNAGEEDGLLWISEQLANPDYNEEDPTIPAKIKNQNTLAVFTFPTVTSGRVTVKFAYDGSMNSENRWEGTDMGSLVYYNEADGSVERAAALYKDWGNNGGQFMHYTVDGNGVKQAVGKSPQGATGTRKLAIDYTVDFDAKTYTIKTDSGTGQKYTFGPFALGENKKANAIYFGLDNNTRLSNSDYKVTDISVTIEGGRKNELDLYGYNGAYLGKEDVIDGKAPVAPKVSGQLFYGWYTDSSYATRITSWADYAGTAAYARYETQITYSEAFPALSTSAVKAGTYTPKNEGDNTFGNIILADSGVNVGAQDGLLWVSEQIKDPNGEGKIKNQNALAVFTFPDVNSGKVIVKFAYDGSNNDENRWEGTDMGSLVYYNEADGSVERAAALYKDWGNNGGNYMHYTIDGNGVKQTVGIAKGATTRTRKLNVEYTVDFDAKTYTVITKDEQANENTFGPFALGENKKANAIYFGLDNNTRLSNSDYKVTDVSVTIEAGEATEPVEPIVPFEITNAVLDAETDLATVTYSLNTGENITGRVVLAVYKSGVLEGVSYSNTDVTLTVGTSGTATVTVPSAWENLTGAYFRLFVWENGTIRPLTDVIDYTVQ